MQIVRRRFRSERNVRITSLPQALETGGGGEVNDVGVCADLGAFFNHADADFTACCGGKLLQSDRRGEAGGAAADDYDVVFHRFALHVAFLLLGIFDCASRRARRDSFEAFLMRRL